MNIYNLKDWWTCEDVWAWLIEAAETNKVMPSARVQGYRSFWPDTPEDPNLAYGYNDVDPRPEPASNREATKWYYVTQWGIALEDSYERDIVWSRARKVPFKVLERRYHCSRQTIHRDLIKCVAYLCGLLNAKVDFEAIARRKIKKLVATN